MDEGIPQGDQQLGNSILVLSTLHPPNLVGSPSTVPLSLELEEFPTEIFEEIRPTFTPNPTPPPSPIQQAGSQDN